MIRHSDAFDDAFDDNGILKDGARYRVPMIMRDSLSPLQRAVADSTARDAKPQFTDGHNIVDPAAGLKPGFRIPVVNDRRSVVDAYARYETGLVNAYRVGDGVQCPDCFGSGEGPDGDDCKSCNGTGMMGNRREGKSLFGSSNGTGRSDDHRTVDQHREMMDRLYRERDVELENAWRTQHG